MSRVIFALCLWVSVALDLSVTQFLRPGAGHGAFPAFTALLLCYIAMFAPDRRTLWFALVAGVVLDIVHLSPRAHHAPEDLRLIGPHALALLLAVLVPLRMRTLVVRRNPLTLGLLAMTTACTAGAALLAIHTVRGFVQGDVRVALVPGIVGVLGGAVFTGVVGVAMGPILLPAASSLGLRIGTVIASGSPRPRAGAR